MKIVKIQTEIKRIPLKTPFVTALRRVENVEFVRVRIICKNGQVGIGEAPATKAITGEGIEDILHSIESVMSTLNNHSPTNALELLHEQRHDNHPICRIGSSAKASLDMALLSLIAKSQKMPLYRYFGAQNAVHLQTDVTISLNALSVMLEDAKKACENNMNILKVKLGTDIKHAIEVIKSISKEIPHAKILVDANQAWSVEGCLHFIDEIKGCKLELIEQPVIASDLTGLKTITDYSDIPILADEAVFTLEDAQNVIRTKSADMINIKLMKCGGVIQAIEILEYCKRKNIQCMLGSMLEGPISINVALHLAMAYSDVIKYIDLDSPLLYKEMSQELEFQFEGKDIVYKNLKS